MNVPINVNVDITHACADRVEYCLSAGAYRSSLIYSFTYIAVSPFVLVGALTGGGVVGLWRARGTIFARVTAARARIR